MRGDEKTLKKSYNNKHRLQFLASCHSSLYIFFLSSMKSLTRNTPGAASILLSIRLHWEYDERVSKSKKFYFSSPPPSLNMSVELSWVCVKIQPDDVETIEWWDESVNESGTTEFHSHSK